MQGVAGMRLASVMLADWDTFQSERVCIEQGFGQGCSSVHTGAVCSLTWISALETM